MVETYEDCVKHGVQCGSLIYCDKCQRSYKTRKYFSNHSCIGEKVNICFASFSYNFTLSSGCAVFG